MKTYNEESIRLAAYYNWQNAGCPSGKDEYFWNQAINQLYGSCSCSTTSSCSTTTKKSSTSKSSNTSKTSCSTSKNNTTKSSTSALTKKTTFNK